MEKKMKTLRDLIDLKDLSVKEAIKKIKSHPELSFFLKIGGLWFLLRWTLGIFFALNMFYTLSLIFKFMFI